VIGKKLVIVFFLLLIGCASQKTSDITTSNTPTSAVVYEIYSAPEVEVSLGRLQYPLSRYGLDIVLNNVGDVSTNVYILLQTSDIRDESKIFCRRTNDLKIPTIHPGQKFVYSFSLDGCHFPRDDNIYPSMRFTIEVYHSKTDKLLASSTHLMSDGVQNERLS